MLDLLIMILMIAGGLVIAPFVICVALVLLTLAALLVFSVVLVLLSLMVWVCLSMVTALYWTAGLPKRIWNRWYRAVAS